MESLPAVEKVRMLRLSGRYTQIHIGQTIADMQTRGMHNDPRYHQMIAIANRLRQQMDNGMHNGMHIRTHTFMCTGGSQQAPPQASPTPLAEQEQTMFDAQVIAYRTLARQMPVPVDVAQRAMRGESAEHVSAHTSRSTSSTRANTARAVRGARQSGQRRTTAVQSDVHTTTAPTACTACHHRAAPSWD
jgi:hypothetical protein